MASKIDWLGGGETWPVLAGCSPKSPGCANCYSARLCATRLKHLPNFAGLAEMRDGVPRWTGEVRLLPHKLEQPLHWRKPRRIFVCDKGDLFHPKVPTEYIAAVFGVMAACPQHTFVVLTKRPARMVKWFEWMERRGEDGRDMFPHDSPEWRMWQMLHVSARRAGADVPPHHGGAWPLPNVHIGVSVEDQRHADERIPLLQSIPAALRWLSLEPQLELVVPNLHLIRWVVAGAESGPGRRRFRMQWASDLKRQCEKAGVPMFLKQVPGMDGKLIKSAELAKAGWPVQYPVPS